MFNYTEVLAGYVLLMGVSIRTGCTDELMGESVLKWQ